MQFIDPAKILATKYDLIVRFVPFRERGELRAWEFGERAEV